MTRRQAWRRILSTLRRQVWPVAEARLMFAVWAVDLHDAYATNVPPIPYDPCDVVLTHRRELIRMRMLAALNSAIRFDKHLRLSGVDPDYARRVIAEVEAQLPPDQQLYDRRLHK